MAPRPAWTELRDALTALRAELLAFSGPRAAALLADIDPARRASATNLLQYLWLRAHDRRDLQRALAEQGLSSLGRSEPHVMAVIDAALDLLERATGARAPARDEPALGFAQGPALLQANADRLFGPAAPGREVRIMVTLPAAAADDPALVARLLAHGMDLARVNAAHDDPAAWRRMAAHVRSAAAAAGRACKIAVDLPGPKCRTGPLTPGPQVVKLRPTRDLVGRVLAPARALLVAPGAAAGPGPALPLPADFLAALRPGDRLRLRDARGRARKLRVGARTEHVVEVLCKRTCYIVPGTRVRHDVRRGASAEVGPLPALEVPIALRRGDLLRLTRELAPGQPARRAPDGRVVEPARIACDPPAPIDVARPGAALWFDDGAIGGVVESVDPAGLSVRIVHAREGGARLRGDKGINFPDARLPLPLLGPDDETALAFAAEAADLVQLSFVHEAEDVRALRARLAALGRPDLGVVLKIETRAAFERLPDLLLAAMAGPAAGVMIARGDLAVEAGYERLAELQEEILALCGAAHTPVVWATQVLETAAKAGQPTRAEITDAAAAERAECVMLNKGPYIEQAIAALADILRRMQAHQDKKRSLFRPLGVAARFVAAQGGDQ